MTRASFLILGLLLIVGLTACSQAPQEQEPQTTAEAPMPPAEPAPEEAVPQAAAPEPAPQPQAAATRPRQQEPRAPRPSAPAPPQTAQQPRVVSPPTSVERAPEPQPVASAPAPPRITVVPAGTRLEISLADRISSAENKTGDRFQATLEEDIQVDGRIVARRGSLVFGKLSHVADSGRVEGRASLTMTLVELRTDSDAHPIRTNTLSFEAEGTKKDDAKKIGAGAGIGAVIGAIAGGKKGAAIGAAVGGGAGTAAVLATKGKDVEFPPEQRFSFVLRSDLEVTRR